MVLALPQTRHWSSDESGKESIRKRCDEGEMAVEESENANETILVIESVEELPSAHD